MRTGNPRPARPLVLAGLLVLAASVAAAQPRPGVAVDARSGLIRTASAEHLGGGDAFLPRADALARLHAMNAGAIESFGHSDWRLPTTAELADLLALRPDLDGRLEGALAEGRVLAWPVRVEKAASGFGGVGDAVLLATNSIYLKPRSAVLSGDVVANDVVTTRALHAGYSVSLAPQASTAAGSDVFGDRVWVQNQAVVGGDVSFNTLRLQGTIQGAEITPLALPVVAELPPFIGASGAATLGDVTVAPNGAVTLVGGDYGHLAVGPRGLVTFQGEEAYSFLSITTGPDARLVFEDATDVRVVGGMRTGNRAFFGPLAGSGLAARQLVVYVEGVVDRGIAAVELGASGETHANFYAPQGLIRIRQRAFAEGAFLGRDIVLEPDARVALDSAFANAAPIAVDDAASVSTGGTVSELDDGAGTVLLNDSDPNGDPLTVDPTPVSGPSNGSLILAADGTFTYTHFGGPDSFDSFTYRVCDDGTPSLCDTAEVRITVLSGSARVTIVKVGDGSGRVLSEPAGIDCGSDCSAVFLTSTPVFLEARADADSLFVGWGGAADCLDAVLRPTVDTTCTAEFEALPPPNVTSVLTVTVSGDGTVSTFPSGFVCVGGSTCSASFLDGTVVTLNVRPDPGFAAVFGGEPDCADGTVTMTTDKTCTVAFVPG